MDKAFVFGTKRLQVRALPRSFHNSIETRTKHTLHQNSKQLKLEQNEHKTRHDETDLTLATSTTNESTMMQIKMMQNMKQMEHA